MKLYLLSVFLIFSICSLAGTNVPAGNVSGTWTTAGSPYMVQGNITIPANQTLTIQPNTYVYFPQNMGLTVNGRLLSQGVSGQTIVFTCLNHSLGWGGISFTSTAASSDSSFISYSRVEYSAGIGITVNTFSKLRINNSDIVYNYGTAGLSVSSSTILLKNCNLNGNTGRGLLATGSTIQLINSNVQSNTGGGIDIAGSTLNMKYGTCKWNSVANSGGGLKANNSTFTAIGCDISANYVYIFNYQYYNGGGLCLTSTNTTLTSCSMMSNTISFINNPYGYGVGGGVYCSGGQLAMYNCVIAKNNFQEYSNDYNSKNGAGIYIIGSNPMIFNSTIANNSGASWGGGIYLYSASSPAFFNCIIYGNTASYGNQVHIEDNNSNPCFESCDVQGGTAGFSGNGSGGSYANNLFTNCINADPVFVDATNGNYRLQATSPCINTGTPSIAPYGLPSTDLAGNPRVYNGRIDIGSYEYCVLQPLITVTSGNPSAWGVRVWGQTAVTKQIVVKNEGAANLKITQIAFADTTRGFSWQYSGLNTNIAVGATATINVTFTPYRLGNYTNTLRITNNSTNQSVVTIPLSGSCTSVTFTSPQNLQLAINNGNAQVSWSPVTTYNNGTAATPSGYFVLFSEIANAPSNQYYFLGYTTATNYTHTNVARYRNSMFYKVVATNSTSRGSFERFSKEKLTWGQICDMLGNH